MLSIIRANHRLVPRLFAKTTCCRHFTTSRFLSTSLNETQRGQIAAQTLPIFNKTFFKPNNDIELKVLKEVDGSEFSKSQLLIESKKVCEQISSLIGNQSNERCAFLTSGVSSVISQFSIWMGGHTAVPLSLSHPVELLEYFIKDSQSSLIIADPEFEARLKPIAEKLQKPLLILSSERGLCNGAEELEAAKTFVVNEVSGKIEQPAMIIYTSGTTNKPKGVVLSHENLDAQISSLTAAWNMTASDTILHTLPLHHVHGLVNALLLPLSVGAKVIMLPKFETEKVWSHLLNINLPQKDQVSVFMAVPTIYSYLVQEYDKLFKKNAQMTEYILKHCSTKIRLMISGSAPLPQTTFKRWKEITGHNLLERYGMTEVGMALSNPLHQDKIRKRLPGFTGMPLPLVEARIVNYENSSDVLMQAKGEFDQGLWSSEVSTAMETTGKAEIVGNLQIKGPTVFKEYFNNPQATKESFTDDGWFITGDSVAFSQESKSFKILGRNNVDIIKSRGYKISALEMETKLLEMNEIEDCAVVGLPDEVLGQKIMALIVYRNYDESKHEEAIADMNVWCKDKFASYSLPVIKIVENIPRNQMGKVNKVELVKAAC